MSSDINRVESQVLNSFHYASNHLSFYKDILQKHNVDHQTIVTLEDFIKFVPLLEKEDIFPVYSIQELCQDGNIDSLASAIVSSGTSGVFSFGLLSHRDVALQKETLDTLLRTLFNTENNPPIIINALPMGVSFASKYPVIPTSVRSDIVLKVIELFKNTTYQIIIITDPHFLKKIVEEGKEQGFLWSSIHMSCIIGGVGFSDSYTTYMEQLLNEPILEVSQPEGFRNQIFGTMGVTEVGLNIFGSTPDLSLIRHFLQHNKSALQKIIGIPNNTVSPALMYTMSSSVFVEVCNADEHGVGDIVMTHLDTELKTILIRYKTGDRGKFIDSSELASVSGIQPILPFPIVAVLGRSTETKVVLTPAEVKELLYLNHEYMQKITGHFIITDATGGSRKITVQMKKEIASHEERMINSLLVTGVAYHEFSHDVELSYENKWKHF